MLYFIYNEKVISVLVCHDIEAGEFVLQVPFYPPFESLSDYKDSTRSIEIIKRSFFSEDLRNTQEVRDADIKIKNVNSWRMEGIVATSYVNKDTAKPCIYLAGDSAHAFPPSGGFGMNTGIGDSVNLAHKLAYYYHNKHLMSDTQQEQHLLSYDSERRYTGELTRDLAMVNYEKGVTIAQKLDLNKNLAEMYTDAVDKYLPSFLPKKEIHRVGLDIGLWKATLTKAFTSAENELCRFLAESKKNSIKLMFPNLDFSYAYPQTYDDKQKHEAFLKANFDEDQWQPWLGLGSLVPHVKLSQSKAFSLRELMT